ncbi:uncharacterized protein [Musca autumnalis]|uniref:uncharacterized protein n=1 Tax=Musca autumnalis TaxID=221902 RepID=UPI003CF71145
MIRLMADKLNFKLILRPMNESLVSEVFENGTVTGGFVGLKNKNFDILMGYYKYMTRTRYFGASASYFLTPTVVAISKNQHINLLHGEWLFAPFSHCVWLLYIFVLLLKIAIVQFLHYANKMFKLNWLDMLGLALANSRNIRYNFQTTRYFVMLCTCGFMIINGSYQGKLYAAFHIKFNPGPKSVPELIARNYTFLKKKFVANEIFHALQIPAAQIYKLNYTNDFESYEQMLSLNYPVAIISNYWPLQAFIKSQRLYDEFEILPSTVVVNQICAYVRPQSFLLEPFNRILNNLNSAGIFKKWLMDCLDVLVTLEEFNTQQRGDKMKTQPIPLSLGKLRLIFIGLMSMHLISLLVFLIEVIIGKFGRK